MNKGKGAKQTPISQGISAPAISLILENEHPDLIVGHFSDVDHIGPRRDIPCADITTTVTIAGSHVLTDSSLLSITNFN